MNTSSVFWSRLIICVMSVTFFLLYASQNRKFRLEYLRITRKYAESIRNSEGLAAQLQVIIDRHRWTQKLLEELRARYDRKINENYEKCRKAIYENSTCKADLIKCTKQLSENEKNYLELIDTIRTNVEDSFNSDKVRG
ncbi:unnamed protein product [Dracunculus medinensis]|uniref:DUF4363 family protein n=1 Tax=Dracunculus medinensis TaxID=318479 RepID=A0A0N4UL05_DRAME|nr:unnamed protein product [Dracunculus medinensis]